MKSRILLSALAVGGLLTSCYEEFTPPTIGGDNYKEDWKSIIGCSIDPKQTWNAAQSLSITVITGEPATVYVLTVDENPHLLYRCEVEDSKLITFDVPQTSGQIRVIKSSESGTEERVLTPATMTNKDSYVYFDGSSVGETKAGIVVTRAHEEGNLPVIDCPYSEQDVENMLNDPNTYDFAADGHIRKTIEHSQWWIETIDKDWFFDINTYYNTKVGKIVGKTLDQGAPYMENSNTGLGEYKLIIGEGGVFKPSWNNQVAGLDIIVANGGTLDLSNIPTDVSTNESKFLLRDCNARLYVMPGGTIIDGTKISDDGTLVSGGHTLQVEGSSILYNEGTIKVGKVNCVRHATCYNASSGEFVVSSFNLNNNEAVLTNHGNFTANKILRSEDEEAARLGTVNNACNLNCKEALSCCMLNLAAYSELDVIKFRVVDVTLRDGSIIRCKDFNSNSTQFTDERGQQVDSKIGYYGTGNQPALISVQNVSYMNYERIRIDKNIYFEANTFEDKTWEQAIGTWSENNPDNHSNPTWLCQLRNVLADNFGVAHKDYVVPKVGKSAANISASTSQDGLVCSRGNGSGDVSGDAPKQSWIIAFEDQGTTGDFDFNDVVIRVTPSLDENHTAKVELMAAGGTLSSNVYYNGRPIGREVHDLFGVPAGKDGESFVNTQRFTEAPVILTDALSLGFDGTMATCAKLFALRSGAMTGIGEKSQFVTLNSDKGSVPKAICVPADKWYWPRERINIRTAYPDFEKWAENYNEGALEGGSTWYKNYRKEYVIIPE